MNALHSQGHDSVCQLRMGQSHAWHVGNDDGEQCERFFSFLGRYTNTKYMRASASDTLLTDMIHLHNQRKAECQAKTLAVAHIVNEKKLLEANAHLLTVQAELAVSSSTSEQQMKTEASLLLAFTAKSQSTSVRKKTMEYAKTLCQLKVVEAAKTFVENAGCLERPNSATP